MGRGSSKAGGGGASVVFQPTNSDSISNKLSAADSFTFSRKTVTMKDANGKTMGMVRSVERFSDMTGSKQFSAYQELKKAGLDNASMRPGGIRHSDIYFNGNQIYIFNNTRQSRFIAGLTPTMRKAMVGEVQKNDRWNQLLKKAEQNGAIIINY